MRLFVERAQALDPRFALDERNVQAVIDICRRLDGLALAIEMAAARVPALGVQGVRERLGERLRMLTAGSRIALRRHQTLRAALDWSHGLLEQQDQVVFRRLGVFSGGCTIEAVQQVASDEQLDEWAVLDAIGRLVDKSLIVADGDDRPRYRMLESARAYALEKLAAAQETDALARRHASYYAAYAERISDALFAAGGTEDGFIAARAAEFDNFRAALKWSLGDDGDAGIALALLGHTSPLGLAGGIARRVRSVADGAEAAPGERGAVAATGRLALRGGDLVGLHDRVVFECRCRRARPLAVSATDVAAAWRTLAGLLCLRLGIAETDGVAILTRPARCSTRCVSSNSRTGPRGCPHCACSSRSAFLIWRASLRERSASCRPCSQGCSAKGTVPDVLPLGSVPCWQRTVCCRGASRRPHSVSWRWRSRGGNSGATRWRMMQLFRPLILALTELDRLDQAREVVVEAMPLVRWFGCRASWAPILALFAARRGRLDTAARLLAAGEARRARVGARLELIGRHANQKVRGLLAAAHADDQLSTWFREGAALNDEEFDRLVMHEA